MLNEPRQHGSHDEGNSCDRNTLRVRPNCLESASCLFFFPRHDPRSPSFSAVFWATLVGHRLRAPSFSGTTCGHHFEHFSSSVAPSTQFGTHKTHIGRPICRTHRTAQDQTIRRRKRYARTRALLRGTNSSCFFFSAVVLHVSGGLVAAACSRARRGATLFRHRHCSKPRVVNHDPTCRCFSRKNRCKFVAIDADAVMLMDMRRCVYLC